MSMTKRESVTHAINHNLHYISLVCIVALGGILLYRIIRILTHSLVSTIMSIQYPSHTLDTFKSSLQTYAHHSLIGHAISFLMLILNAFVHLCVTVLRAVITAIYVFLPFVIFSVILVIINEKWVEFMIFIIESFNTSLGDTFNTIVMFPINMLDLIGSNVLPALNFCIYVIVQTPIQLLYAVAIGEGKNHFISFLKGTAESFPAFTESFQDFVTRNAMSCRDHMTVQQINGNNNVFLHENGTAQSPSYSLCFNHSDRSCTELSLSDVASSCFESHKREIDLFSGFSKFQSAAGHGIMTIGASCHAIALFMNVTLYPLVDPDLWMSLDRAGNAIMHAFISAPSSAIQRCAMAGGIFKRPAMCTPDFGHAFDLLAASSTLLGNAITNWIDMGYNIVRETASIHKKDVLFDYNSTCNVKSDYEYVLSDKIDKVRSRLMGANVTALVRMTPSTFALTDGSSAVFVEHSGSLQTSYAPHIWPPSANINTKYGIARTIMPSGSSVNDNGVGLFGCSCRDNYQNQVTTVSMQCSIVTKDGTSWILPVEWSLSTQTQLLSCDRLKIVVQSLRWPQKRVVISNLNAGSDFREAQECSLRRENCLTGDVVIYAIPICGSQDGLKSMACFPENYFTKGICFPYCMALHMRGEMAQPIIMRGAAEWENGVLIAGRDCVPFSGIQKTEGDNNLNQVLNEPAIMKSTCTIQSTQSLIKSNAYQQVSASSSFVNFGEEPNACSFRSSCITEVWNKSYLLGTNYYGPTDKSKIPVVTSRSGDNGVRLFLDYQPLVVAGGVQLRRYPMSIGIGIPPQYLVDFPTLVGNQYNEFTVEYHADIGVPVAEQASVLSKESEFANKNPGQLYLSQSLDYAQTVIPHGPSVLSVDVMWYATNPSFDWITGMINYCTTRGVLSQTQIMFLSSYNPMRLWRVQYKRSACYFSAPSPTSRTCSPNVSMSFALSDSSHDIPKPNANAYKTGSELMDMCTSSKQYNLWVESLEDFDEYNIVIAMRRAHFADLGYLLSDAEMKGTTAFYFISKFSYRMQEAAPWTRKDYFVYLNQTSMPSNALLLSSCPKLRLLPDVGKFVGHSLAALAFLFKVPVNAVLNPFAIQELLVARSRQRCPENSLKHSVLENCGMNLFSLEDYFENMYAANEAFWEIASWLVHQIVDSGNVKSKEVEMFGQFLQGAVVTGDATRIISIFEITRYPEFMDLGIEEVIFKTDARSRRRLLSVSSVFSHLTGFVKSGLGSLFSITKTVSSAVAGNLFSGADLGSLMAGQNPVAPIIGTSFTMPVLAWAQVTYESILPMALDLLANAQNNQYTLKPLWVHMYDTLDRYDHVIHERHKQACAGIRLMIGYGSSLGAAVYYNCLAAAEMPRGVWTVALTMFVDMGLYRCLCVNPVGQEYISYTFQNCEYLISSNRKGLWQNILSTQNVNRVCAQYSTDIERQMFGAFDTWTKYSFLASEAITSVLDEFFVQRTQAMDCNNLNDNPSAIVLHPMPSHHFHVCAKTSSCRKRCEDSIAMFEAEYMRVQKSGSIQALRSQHYYDHQVESPFFNKYSSDWMQSTSGSTGLLQSRNRFIRGIKSNPSPSDSLWYSHPDSPCSMRCKNKNDYCLAIVVENILMNTNSYGIEYFCIPGAGSILASVFHAGIRDDKCLENLENMKKTEGFKISHVEFSIQNTSAYSSATYLYVYTTKKTTAVSITPSLLSSYSTESETNEVLLWTCDSTNPSAGTPEYVLTSKDIESKVLGTNLQQALFGDKELYEISVSSCKILVCVEIFSGIPNDFALFFSCSLQIKVSFYSEEESKTKTVTDSYTVHGIRHYCDMHASIPYYTCVENIEFHTPCGLCAQLEDAHTRTSCRQMCMPQLDTVIKMAEQGSLLHMQQRQYFFLPTNNFRMKLDEETGELTEDIQFGTDNFANKGVIVEIDPNAGVISSAASSSSSQLGRASSNFKVYAFNPNMDGSTSNALGTWSRLDVFSTSLVTVKPIRGSHMHSYYENNGIRVLYYYHVDQGVSSSSSGVALDTEWLQQARLKQNSRGWEIESFKSASAFQKSSLVIFCNVTSCLGCGTSKLRLLCHAAQDCTLSKCIGTLVQTRNVFCGVGNVFEKMAMHAILTWKAIFMSCAEISLILMRGLSGEIIREISLKFPTDQFYTLVCSCKDTFASMVGLGMSLIQTLSAHTAWGGLNGRMTGSSGLSLSGNSEDISALIGEENLKTASIGGLFFNLVTSSTLIPALALHRFLICTINSSLALTEENEAMISIQFEDIAMDQTWAACVKVGGISNLVNSIDMSKNIGTIIEAFVSFSLSLLSGLGETVLYALQLSFDSTIDLFISLVWSLQDILYTFNMRSCKVPNYALRYVLWCTCNDKPFWIPDSSRQAGLNEGALWCVGTLSVNLIDGTPNAIVYNPYTLIELSRGIQHVVRYIECLSTQSEATGCQTFRQQQTQSLPILGNQGVEPIAVWAKCKLNYLQKTWDNAAGAAFVSMTDGKSMPFFEDPQINVFSSVMTSSDKSKFISWAQSISPSFLECMQEISRLKIDYSSCMNMYFDKTRQQTKDAFFIYDNSTTAPANEPPDACMVFSGIASSCSQNMSTCTPLQEQFKSCVVAMTNNMDSDSFSTDAFLIDDDYQKTSKCEMNPTIWSTTQSNKVGVAKYHGLAAPWNKHANDANQSKTIKLKYARDLYEKAAEKLQKAWEQFNATFEHDVRDIDVMIFSADGDFIHNFMDCMFLGPYTRMDFYPCDDNGNLDCPFYARDEDGGMTRNFTPCFGRDIMYNDSIPPYTCGSRERRSIIKYFFREILSKQELRVDVSNHIQAKIKYIVQNYTNEQSLGCYDLKSNRCTPEACSFENGFAPCLDTNYEISSHDTEAFIINMVLSNLPDYYQQVMQDTMPWTLYSNVSSSPSQAQYPFQWKEDPVSAHAALNLGHFSPTEAIVNYSKTEVYTMSKTNTKEDRVLSSLWGSCMALLSQPSSTIPIEKIGKTDGSYVEVPVGFWNTFVSTSLTNKTTEEKIEELTRSIMDAAMNSHSPFHWHRNRRHAPSKSNFCRKDQPPPYLTTPTKPITITPLTLHFSSSEAKLVTAVPDYANSSWIRQYGLLRNTIGEAHFECVCGTISSVGQEYCDVSMDTCRSFKEMMSSAVANNNSSCQILESACNDRVSPKYKRDKASQVMDCLKSMNDGRVRCPEFALSDIWGFFPVDCSEQECENAPSWIGVGTSEITYETTRFLSEGRGGIRMSNYKHHNKTYEEAMNFKAQGTKTASDFAISKCYAPSELSPDPESELEEGEGDISKSVEEMLSKLFPMAQIVFESHVLASCSRFVIELARAQALDFLNEASSEKVFLQALTWKQKCASKIKHLKMCDFLGIFFDIPPPLNWRDLARPKCSSSVAQEETLRLDSVYLTPWCVLVNRTSRTIHDASTCIANGVSLSQCPLMNPSPFSLLNGETPVSMLYSTEAKTLLPPQNAIQELLFSPFDLFLNEKTQHIFNAGINILEVYKQSIEASKPEADHISHVLDWWADDMEALGPGYHMTSASDKDELAPMLFDSHFAYDSESHIAFYLHSTLRDPDLMHQYLGTCGICRLQTISMPLMESNTNRICTRMSKYTGEDVPSFPVTDLKKPGGKRDARTSWPVDDIDQQAFIDLHFEQEFCAESPYSVPWQLTETDKLSFTAGGIPDWNDFVSTDSNGVNRYRSSNRDVYPAYDNAFIPILRHVNHETIFSSIYEKGWGPCENTVHWKSEIDCDTQDQNQMCPQDGKTTCLKTNETSTSGMCYPVTQRSSPQVEYPCFAGFHCPDNLVCLANGKCGPLYLHVWNDESYALEFSVIADSCGFQNTNHPYTQSSKGASPWEQVPDLLHVHGFCSLRNWFSYRHSINVDLCPIIQVESNQNKEYLECDSSNVSWPWIIERFDGKSLLLNEENARESMQNQKMLHMKPHACDKEYLHLGNPLDNSTRLEFCSGFEGHQKPLFQNSHFVYKLNPTFNDWSNSTKETVNAATSTSHWMRSLDVTSKTASSSPKIRIGKLNYDEQRSNVPLGFLGADLQSPNQAISDLAAANTDGATFRFFKCADRMACSPPPFTYNGIPLNRLDPSSLSFNFSENSLRKCGSIGYIHPTFWSNDNVASQVCLLDIHMFPVLMTLLDLSRSLGNQVERGCFELLYQSFSPVDQFKAEMNIIVRTETLHDYITQPTRISDDKTTLMCSISQKTLCAYRARSTGVLTEANENDHIQTITDRLNSLIYDFIHRVATRQYATSSSHVFENINQCVSDIMRVTRQEQSELQRQYNSMDISGVYIAMKFGLYEIPLKWFHHALCIALLSTIDPRIRPPNIRSSMDLPLWNGKDRNMYCRKNSEEIKTKSVLLKLLCEQQTLESAFYIDSLSIVNDLQVEIINKALTDVRQSILVNSESAEVHCYTQAYWKCDELMLNETERDQCRQAIYFMHNNTCPAHVSDNSFRRFLDPCLFPQNFRFNPDQLVEMPSTYYEYRGSNSISTELNQINQIIETELVNAIDKAIDKVNYISESIEENIVDGKIGVLKINSILKILQASPSYNSLNADFEDWFNHLVCREKYDVDENYACKKQQNIDTVNECLYPNTVPENEHYRFAQDNENYVDPETQNEIITIVYSDDTKDTIQVCDALFRDGSHYQMKDSNEYCLVQHFDNVLDYLNNDISDIEHEFVPCNIKSIFVPPGIEVQAFAFEFSKETWNDTLRYPKDWEKVCKHDATQNVRSCSWSLDTFDNNPEKEAWLFGADPAIQASFTFGTNTVPSYLQRSSPLELEFSGMKDWWSSHKDQWNRDGCGTYSGICALKFRLESVPTESQAYCSAYAPSCSSLLSSSSYNPQFRRIHPFASSKSSKSGQTKLYRCAPCTRREQSVNSKEKEGLFGCHLRKTDATQTFIPSISQEYVQKSIEAHMPYIQNASSLKSTFLENSLQYKDLSAHANSIDNGTNILMNTISLDQIFDSTRWKKRSVMNDNTENNTAYVNPMILDSIEIAIELDMHKWENAIKNPHRTQTMNCEKQSLSPSDFETCNQHIDNRRALLRDFAENIYRQKNGLWLSKVDSKEGYAWRANVGHPKVKMFSLAYAAADNRPLEQVVARHTLGEAICSETKNTRFKDRVCMESILHSNLPFEQFHPWLGGDMNPFEGKRGLDQCSNGREICACDCYPSDHCQDPRGIKNYTSEFMNREFVLSEEACQQRIYPRTSVLQADDPSNLCSYMVTKSTSTGSDVCLHSQGIFGGLNGRDLNGRVSDDVFYSHSGVSINREDVLIQEMYSDTANGLWMGNSLFEETRIDSREKAAFLQMDRKKMYPGHIAFGIDKTKSNSPLVLKSMALLPYDYDQTKMPAQLSEPKRWLKRLFLDCSQEIRQARKIYPQAIWNPLEKNNQAGHWSCPFRLYSFWGDSGDDLFSPQVPNPVISKKMFSHYSNCKGAHPLVQMRSARYKLKTYKTTNGYCFYESDATRLTTENVPLEDSSNPCGLKQTIWHLHDSTWALSRVMNHFRQRCNDIIDYPDLGGTLRSGEIMSDGLGPDAAGRKCGVLHRLSPFLMRTRGDVSKVRVHRNGLTTHSPGGDCHMGRAFLYPLSSKKDLDGRECSIVSKTAGKAEAKCRSSTQTFVLHRAKPLSVTEWMQKKPESKRLKKDLRLLIDSQFVGDEFVIFKGPSDGENDDRSNSNNVIPSEVSFGLHYSTSLTKMLADDYLHHCKTINNQKETGDKYAASCSPIKPWVGGFEFLRRYVRWPSSAFATLTYYTQKSSTTTSYERPPFFLENMRKKQLFLDMIRDIPPFMLLPEVSSQQNERVFADALLRDAALWNTPNWTWSYYQITETNSSYNSNSINSSNSSNSNQNSSSHIHRFYTGTVDKAAWKKNRFQACKQSHDAEKAKQSGQGNSIEFTTVPVTLCEPAPTASLQEFCKTLLQYRMDIAKINCQLMGNNNECLFSPSMFYVPYAWSNTNQEFAAETVMRYYNQTIASKYPSESMSDVCPYRGDLYANMVRLSIETKRQCPAEQVEYLKDTLSSIKAIGKDILYMGYCFLMFVLNVVSMALTLTGQAAASMSAAASHYLEEFFSTAGRIIMPILNAVISLLFGTSSSGKIMKDILIYLCEIYNWIMENIIVKIWCGVIMPILQVVFEAIKFFIPKAGELDVIWKALSGGHSGFDVPACIGRLRLTIECRPPDYLRRFNESEFQTAHLATRCWIDSTIKNGYSSSVFGGSSDFSYLSCSVSDTCAKESLKIDDYIPTESNLIPCASCPEVDLQDSAIGQKFGCNSALKRCTCSVNSHFVSECMTNSDCSSSSIATSTDVVCGVANMLDSIRNAPSSVLCSQCGQYGQQPVCVIDGRAETGVCGCGSILDATFLESCPVTSIGQTVSLIQKTKKCLFYPNFEEYATEIEQHQLDFSDAAIGPCLLGMDSRIKCLSVILPTQNQFYQNFPRSFVVIVDYRMQYSVNLLSKITSQPQIIANGNRRRLLSQAPTLSWQDEFKNLTKVCLNETTSRHDTAFAGSRELVKYCIHNKQIQRQLKILFNETADLGHTYHSNRWKMLFMRNQSLLQKEENPYLKQFLKYQWAQQDPRNAFIISHAADNLIYETIDDSLEALFSYYHFLSSSANESRVMNASWNQARNSRSLLSTSYGFPSKKSEEDYVQFNEQESNLPPYTCYALRKPLVAITNAFWDTAKLYESMHNPSSSSFAEKNDSNNTSSSPSSWWYTYPPLSNASSYGNSEATKTWIQILSHQLISWVFSGGSSSGEQIIQAMTSNISHDESIEKNYFTGNRLVRELSQCNYTTLTFGPNPKKELMPWLLALLAAAYILASFFSSSYMISLIIWLVLFPIALFWTVYNVSPLCWPMIPPQLPRDLAFELSNMVPTSIKIPYYVISDECLSYKTFSYEGETLILPTSDDILTTISNINASDKRKCFKKCQEKPFYMRSWQDPLAWWSCDINIDFCMWLARIAENLPLSNNFVQSTHYFVEVLKLRNINPEFVQAHRFCAFFNSHDTVLAGIFAACIILIVPSLLQFLIEISTGAVVLVIHASGSEIIE